MSAVIVKQFLLKSYSYTIKVLFKFYTKTKLSKNHHLKSVSFSPMQNNNSSNREIIMKQTLSYLEVNYKLEKSHYNFHHPQQSKEFLTVGSFSLN